MINVLWYFVLWPNRDRLRCWMLNRLIPIIRQMIKRILIKINAIIIGFGGTSDGMGSWLISNWHRLPARPGGHWQCFTLVIDVRKQIPFLKYIVSDCRTEVESFFYFTFDLDQADRFGRACKNALKVILHWSNRIHLFYKTFQNIRWSSLFDDDMIPLGRSFHGFIIWNLR